jgi:cytochrome c-type biogenesis protein CcmH/NrfG
LPTVLDAATLLCERAVAVRPDRADPWNTIGTIRSARDDRAGAIDALAPVCTLAPDNPVFQWNLKHAKNSSGK